MARERVSSATQQQASGCTTEQGYGMVCPPIGPQ
jgi:hypothetical protein